MKPKRKLYYMVGHVDDPRVTKTIDHLGTCTTSDTYHYCKTFKQAWRFALSHKGWVTIDRCYLTGKLKDLRTEFTFSDREEFKHKFFDESANCWVTRA